MEREIIPRLIGTFPRCFSRGSPMKSEGQTSEGKHSPPRQPGKLCFIFFCSSHRGDSLQSGGEKNNRKFSVSSGPLLNLKIPPVEGSFFLPTSSSTSTSSSSSSSQAWHPVGRASSREGPLEGGSPEGRVSCKGPHLKGGGPGPGRVPRKVVPHPADPHPKLDQFPTCPAGSGTGSLPSQERTLCAGPQVPSQTKTGTRLVVPVSA